MVNSIRAANTKAVQAPIQMSRAFDVTDKMIYYYPLWIYFETALATESLQVSYNWEMDYWRYWS